MTTPSIRQLLEALPDETRPDDAVAARIRAAVERELADALAATARRTSTADAIDPLGDEADAVILIAPDPVTTQRGRAPRRNTMGAAVAAVFAAVTIGLFVLVVRDESPATVSTADAPTEVPASEDAADESADGVDARSAGVPSFAGAIPDTRRIDDGGINPFRVAVADHLWTMSLDGDLVRRDEEAVVAQLDVRVPQSSYISASEDAVWAADTRRGDVRRLDPVTGEIVAVIETGVRVAESSFPSAELGFLSGAPREAAKIGAIDATTDLVWLGDQDGRLLAIDPATNSITRVIEVGISPDLVRADGAYVAVAERLSGDGVVVVDADSGAEVLRIESSSPRAGVALHRSVLYIHEPAVGKVTRVDLETGERVVNDGIGTHSTAPDPLVPPIIAADDAGVLVVGDDALVALDPTTLSEIDRFVGLDLRAGELMIAPDGTAWIVEFYGSELTRIVPVRTTGRAVEPGSATSAP